MTRRIVFAACAGAMLVTSVAAQSPSQRADSTVRVQATINYFVPGPTDDSPEAQKLRDRSRQIVYDTAARECDLLRETLAKDCRLESVNSNTNASRQQFGQMQQEGLTISGSMNIQITLK